MFYGLRIGGWELESFFFLSLLLIEWAIYRGTA
jgi:hypothetical protein